MHVPDRLDLTLRLVRGSGRLTLADLAGRLGVSEMTVRRDLDQLQEQGLVRRVRGGAVALDVPSDEAGFAVREQWQAATKARLARATAELITPGSTVLLDAGTTTAAVAAALAARFGAGPGRGAGLGRGAGPGAGGSGDGESAGGGYARRWRRCWRRGWWCRAVDRCGAQPAGGGPARRPARHPAAHPRWRVPRRRAQPRRPAGAERPGPAPLRHVRHVDRGGAPRSRLVRVRPRRRRRQAGRAAPGRADRRRRRRLEARRPGLRPGRPLDAVDTFVTSDAAPSGEAATGTLAALRAAGVDVITTETPEESPS